MAIKEQPLNKVRWVSRAELSPNDYNPNSVAPVELQLLKTSIMEDGWTQPIVALPDGTIVDGYHRWLVSADPDVAALTGGKVPVVTVALDPVHRKMSTIRHNRARGTHAVLKMAEIVRGMIEDGVKFADLENRLGMEDEEIFRLADRSGMPTKVLKQGGTLGKAWVPERAEEDA